MHMLDVTNWADKNTWKCMADDCKLELPSRVKLVLHIRRSHDMTALEYFRKYKDSLITETQHTCQVKQNKINLHKYLIMPIFSIQCQ